jgi:methionyl aminopeptidase
MKDSNLSYEELRELRKPGKVAAKVFRGLKRFIRPGISTKDIEIFFESILRKYPGMEAAFKGHGGYPASLCVSVNEEVIHGIPSHKKIINDGDIVSVDLGIVYKGLYVDTAYSYLVGRVSSLGRKLLKVCYAALQEAIKKVRVNAYIGDIGETIQTFVENKGFSVVRSFVGHGIGRRLHCPPEVPNFGVAGTGERLDEGTVIAIEPMICSGRCDVDILDDAWGVKTKDNSLSCHFEHTVAVTKRGPLVITK